MQVGLDFTSLAGSQQPLGVCRSKIQDIEEMDPDMYLDTPAYLTSEVS